MKNRKLVLGVIMVITYLLCVGISYLVFSRPGKPTTNVTSNPTSPLKKGTDGRVTFDENAPKTESCPINGVQYSKEQKDWWSNHRPLGIMIENHEDARPQSGISFADITYETVAEGGITRTLNVFYCQDGGQVGPVRSARTYFLDWISEYGAYPLYAHVGGANTPGPADALGQIEEYGWAGYNDLNQFSIGFPTFWRDYDRLGHDTATEHTMYSTTSKLWDFAAKKRNLTNVDKTGALWNQDFVPYTFEDGTKGTNQQLIHLEFWSGYKAYFVDWKYDPKTGLYMRSNGGVAHIDKDTNKQLSARDVVVLSMDQTHADDGYENNAHLLFDTTGTGKAYIFMDGKQIKGTWKKASRTARTLIYDNSGSPIKFERGKMWFEIMPTDGVIDVQ